MKIQSTEKKYWVNGIQKRGKDFITISTSFKNKAVLLSFSISLKYLSINFFNLN
jgi:hypothetical protein